MRHVMVAVATLFFTAHSTVAQVPAPKAPARPAATARSAPTSPGAGAVIVVETLKGNIEIETYPNEAPKTVEHILDLVKRNFFNGHRIHRVEQTLIQFGDPQTRDMTKRAQWGKGFGGGSGKPVGVAEFSKKRPHKVGAVAMAHPGDARQADSQIYITLAALPKLDGKYTVFGQVISGMSVVRSLVVTDRIVRVTIRPEAPGK